MYIVHVCAFEDVLVVWTSEVILNKLLVAWRSAVYSVLINRGGLGSLAFARWASWSAGQVGRHVRYNMSAYSSLFVCYKYLLTLPVSQVACERCFGWWGEGVPWVDQIWGQHFGTLGPCNFGTPYPNHIEFILR